MQIQNFNKLSSIYGKDGKLYTSLEKIRSKVERFYKKLLGSRAVCLPHVDLHTMRAGHKLTDKAQKQLIRPATKEDIDSAVRAIDDSKERGLDGFNSFFFKKVWHIVKEDIYEVTIHFFTTGKLLKQWNCTIITLVPKVQNPTYVKEYQPIACCTVMY